MIKFLFFSISIFFYTGLWAQPPSGKISRDEYIQLYYEIAIEEMNIYHIPASITLAQGILESGNGNSSLARKANNHFGIKCHKGWNGKTYHMDDDTKNECFRKYSGPYESFKDHSIFLSTRNRYAFLFELELEDYKGWAHGLKRAGYATNPKYPKLLIKLIEEHELYNFDTQYKGQTIAYSKDNKKQISSSIEDFEAITIGAANRQIYENNGVKFIQARKGDSFYKIAQDFNIYTWQVYNYNDLKKKNHITESQILYLGKKKNKGSQPFHIVKQGETLHDISQTYAVKLKKLYKYNSLDKNAKLFLNQKIKLRR